MECVNTEASRAPDAHHRLKANLSCQVAREDTLELGHLLLLAAVEEREVMNGSTAEFTYASWKIDKS